MLYRADRLAAPQSGLPLSVIGPDDAWCDDPGDARYNRQVVLPYAGGHERLWREDGVYDVVVVLGHNHDPPRPGAGSAVFLHVARADFAPTAGCVALALNDLLTVLRVAGPDSRVCVQTD